MQLNKIQSSFKNLMLDHPDAVNTAPEDFRDIFASGNVALSKRLKIYRNNIIGSLTDVMLATFPLTEALVGKEFLEHMARSFILQNPPEQSCLSFYGVGFDQFIEGFEPAKALPYLPDIARLEIAMNEAYYAKDDAALTAKELSDIPHDTLEQLDLNLRTSARIVSSHYPLRLIKDFCENTSDETQNLDISVGGENLLVYRPALDVAIIPLEEDEKEFLNHLTNGDNFGQAADRTLNKFNNFNIGKYLSKHIELETFSSFHSNI